jgi:peroxiredoxin Q/BCP
MAKAKKKSTLTKKSPARAKPKPASATAKPASATAKPAKPAEPKLRAARVAAGATMPAFSLPDQSGALVTSRSLAGKAYVLYFYPKDDTPGCTREACGFRDGLSEFQDSGVRVIGVSPDKPESHQKFRSKYSLPFTLLSDTDKTLANALGVWVKKQNYGREYMGIERSTFLVDARGKVQQVWHSVKVDGHVDKVLEAARGSD